MSGVRLWMALLAFGVAGVLGRWPVQSCDNQEIKDMLSVLTNEVVQLKKEVRKLNGDEKVEDEKNGGLKILSVSRKSVNGGKGRYTIRYQVPVNATMPVHTFWNEYNDYSYTQLEETFSNEISTLPPGVFETSVVTTIRNDSHLMVTIGGNDHFVALFIHNDDTQDMTETNVELPMCNITPKDDIVYYPGHNATVEIQTNLKDQKDEENVISQFVLTKPGLENLITRYNGGVRYDVLFHVENEIKYTDKVEQKVAIQTDKSSYSGILRITAGIEKKTGLIKRIEIHKELVLRPSTQKGPFPDGKIYLGNIQLHEKRNKNGDFIRFCHYGQECSYYCQFYGNDLLKLELFKTVNGIKTQEQFKTKIDNGVFYSKLGIFEVSPVESDPFPVTYACVATNIEGQAMTSKSVVSFGNSVEILEDETSKESFDNGTAKLVCTARGLPLPKVTIWCDATEAQSEIVYRSEDVIRVEATCYDVTDWTWMVCNARNEFTNVLQYSYNTNYTSHDLVLDYAK